MDMLVEVIEDPKNTLGPIDALMQTIGIDEEGADEETSEM